MELSLPLVLDDEVDAFVERVARERFKGRGKDDSAKRRTACKRLFFDLFNPRSQMKFFEFGAIFEGPLSDAFYRIREDDGGDFFTFRECLLANLDDRDSVNMLRNLQSSLETFVAPGDANA